MVNEIQLPTYSQVVGIKNGVDKLLETPRYKSIREYISPTIPAGDTSYSPFKEVYSVSGEGYLSTLLIPNDVLVKLKIEIDNTIIYQTYSTSNASGLGVLNLNDALVTYNSGRLSAVQIQNVISSLGVHNITVSSTSNIGASVLDKATTGYFRIAITDKLIPFKNSLKISIGTDATVSTAISVKLGIIGGIKQ